MKKIVFCLLFCTTFALGAGNNIKIPSEDGSKAYVGVTFTNNQVDTIFYQRPAILAGLAFSMTFDDSVVIQNVIMRRMVQNELMPVQVGDTVFKADSNFVANFNGSTANPSYAKSTTVTLTPLCDAYVFFVTYGVIHCGTTNPKVYYVFQQQCYKQ